MSEPEKIIWTAAFTILGGVLVYVIGQLLSKFLIDPTHELKKAIGEVRFNLAFPRQSFAHPSHGHLNVLTRLMKRFSRVLVNSWRKSMRFYSMDFCRVFRSDFYLRRSAPVRRQRSYEGYRHMCTKRATKQTRMSRRLGIVLQESRRVLIWWRLSEAV